MLILSATVALAVLIAAIPAAFVVGRTTAERRPSRNHASAIRWIDRVLTDPAALIDRHDREDGESIAANFYRNTNPSKELNP